MEDRFRDQHPEVIDWQQHIVTWGKRFCNGDGTSHDVPWTELEKYAEGIDDNDDDDQAGAAVTDKKYEGKPRPTSARASIAPEENVEHVRSRNPTERSTGSAVRSRVTASLIRNPAQVQARAQIVSIQSIAPAPPASPPTIKPELLTGPAPLRIGPIDQWIQNGQYNRSASFLQHLARKFLLPEANDMCSREE